MWWMTAALAAPLTVGVVVESDEVWVMTDEGVSAVHAIRGDEAWRNAEVLAPLEAHDALVLALGLDSRALVLLDRASGREAGRCASIPAPEWATPLGNGLGTSFQVRGGWDGEAFVVGWYAGAWATGGAVPSLDASSRKVATGRVRCRPDGASELLAAAGDEGTWTGTALPPPASAPVDPAWTWAGLSVDGRHLAGVTEGSAAVALRELGGRHLVDLPNAPWGKAFVVSGGRYVTIAVDEQGRASVIGQAFDRASPLVWRVGVKDLQYRGPFPPSRP